MLGVERLEREGVGGSDSLVKCEAKIACQPVFPLFAKARGRAFDASQAGKREAS